MVAGITKDNLYCFRRIHAEEIGGASVRKFFEGFCGWI